MVGLPEPEAGTVLIASAMVADAVRRPDVMSPGELVRNEAGQPIGCKGLTAYANPPSTNQPKEPKP